MKSQYRRWTEIGLTAVILLITAMGIWFSRQVRQQHLDSSLIAAIKRRDTEAVSALLDQGANPNATDKPNDPITLNSLYRDCVNRLEGSGPTKDTVKYKSALMLVYGQVNFYEPGTIMVVVRFTDASIVDEQTRPYRQDPEPILSALLHHGARLNAKEHEGETLLGNACVCGDVKTVQLLLNFHIDPNGVGRDGTTLLQFPPIIYTRDGECARLLLEHGADANTRQSDGRTRLMTAEENIKLFSLLLEHGADPNVQDRNGETALMHLVNRLDPGSSVLCTETRLLVEHGAKISLRNKQGRTALDMANGVCIRAWWPQGFSRDRYEKEVIADLKSALKRETTILPPRPLHVQASRLNKTE